MGLQSICYSFGSPIITYPRSPEFVCFNAINGGDRRLRLTNAAKSYPHFNLKWAAKISRLPRVKEVLRVNALHSDSDLDAKVKVSSKTNREIPVIRSDSQAKLRVSEIKYGGIEPFGGKSGSVSFYGVTHHVVEESKLVSTPFKDGGGSILWVFAPLVFILSLVLPPLFISTTFDTVFKNEYLADIASTLASEAVFYAGIAMFLLITDRVQRPYLQYTAKRWGLITGLKGHLSASFFVMGLKVIAPLVVTYVTWPMIGVQALVAVTPLLVGYLAQLAVESFIDWQGSSCWPLVPVIFEVYRFYQLTRAVTYVESLRYAMGGTLATPEVMEKGRALAAMSATFYIVALVCLWSLLTYLLRLFPSRPVAENY